jgi:putative DNA primase/helicase
MPPESLSQIIDALSDRFAELVAETLGKPVTKGARAWRWLSPGQKKNANPGFILNRAGPRYGKFQDFTAGHHGDALQFITDYRCNGDRKAAVAEAKRWLRWDNGASPLPVRRDAARRRERAEQEARDEAAAAAEEAQRIAEARSQWAQCQPIAGTPGEMYLRRRNILPATIPDCVRWSIIQKAVVFAVTSESGDIVALQYVAVTPDGQQDKERLWRKSPKPRPKDSFGPIGRGTIRFPGDVTRPICYAEGAETAMSVWMATGLEVHAMLGVTGFRRISDIAPRDRRVILLRDDDADYSPSYKAAQDAVSALRTAGRDFREAWPHDTRHKDGSDFNDIGAIDIKRRIGIANYDAPVTPKILYSVETARARLEEYVREFFEVSLRWDRNTRQPVHVLRLSVGGGKSHYALLMAIRYIKKLRQTGDMRPVLFLIPEHRLADEIAERARNIAREEGAEIAINVYRGRRALNPNGVDDDERMCRNHEVVGKAYKYAANIEDDVCAGCKFKSGCAYLAQKDKSADLWIAAHQFIFNELRKPLTEHQEKDPETGDIIDTGIAAMIIDENIVGASLFGLDGKGIVIPLDLLASDAVPVLDGDPIFGSGARLRENRGKLADALRKQPLGFVPKDVLRQIGFEAQTGKDMAKAEWSRVVRDGHWSERAANLTVRPFTALWRAIENALDKDGDVTGYLQIVETEEGAKAVRIIGRSKVSKSVRVPTLHIDASLDVELIQHLWPNMTVLPEIEISAPHQTIRQTVGKSFAQTYLTPPKNGDAKQTKSRAKAIRALRALIMREARAANYSIGVVSNQAVIAEMRLPASIPTLHFNALRGRDNMRGVRKLIVIGRPSPGAEDVELRCAALTGRPASVSLGKTQYPKTSAERLLRDGRGTTKIPAMVDCHPDEMCERLRKNICDAELAQAIGRARGVNRTAENPVEVIVLTDVLLDTPIDEVLSDDWLAVTEADKMLAEGGIATTDGSVAASLYPELYPNPAAARQALFRDKANHSVTFSNRYSHWRLSRCAVQKAAERAKPVELVVDLSLCTAPRLMLEAALGPLALFQMQDEPAVAVGAESLSVQPSVEPVVPDLDAPGLIHPPPDGEIVELSDERFQTFAADGRLWVRRRPANDDGLRLDWAYVRQRAADGPLDLAEIARESGVSRADLGDFESGVREPTEAQAAAVLRAVTGRSRPEATEWEF